MRETFDVYPAEARADELARRLLSPITYDTLVAGLARAHQIVRQEEVRLADEHFLLVVPPTMPASGYALLVFIPPWSEARLPSGWGAALNRLGVIFVSADRSGNDESILERREPLALIAATNVMRRYRVDPDKVFIGGFSGGSRVALRLALAYPDLFRGAFLNAGSDPIGDVAAPLPEAPLFAEFQRRTRVALMTGALDDANLQKDADAQLVLHRYCLSNVTASTVPGVAHEPVPRASFETALRFLLSDAGPEPAKSVRCRAALDDRLAADVGALDRFIAAGDAKSASRARTELDNRYGWLAADALRRAGTPQP